MDPVMAALLFGFFGICIVWTLAKNAAGRWEENRSGRPADEYPASGPDEGSGEGGDVSPEALRALYRRLTRLRLASIGLGLVAIAVLYLQWHSALALLLGFAACALQWRSYRIRVAHLRARRLVPPARRP